MKALREWLWPVKSSELSKFLPVFGIKMCASFVFSILATIKDTVIVTTSGGAEVIPVLKGGVVIVFAFLAMILYSKLSNHISRRNLFYVMLLPFLTFFLIYGFILFPHQHSLSLNNSADWLLELVGSKHQHWVAVYRYWMHSLFFVIAELWGGVVIGLLFWGFVNQITSIKDATRFYVLYSTGGHLGTLLSGGLIFTCTSLLNQHQYKDIIGVLMLIAATVCGIIIFLYWYTNHHLNKEENANLSVVEMRHKTSLSLKDSIKYITSSPYLGLIAMMVIGYGLSVNLIEVTWKSLVKLQYPDPNAYQSFMGIVQFILGATSIVLAVFFSGAIMRKLGWYFTARLTPIVLGITSLLFFILYFIFPDLKSTSLTIFSLSPLMLLVICGAAHNVACKSMKYCMFDPTKEMAYIPLDAESKTKGKAAVDLVGARFGKTGSSWIQLLLIDLAGSGSILTVVPFLVPVIGLVVFGWLKAVFKLNTKFKGIQLDNQEETADQIAAINAK